MNDDGRATDGHGSRILDVTLNGEISVLMGADKMTPVAGFDLAPSDFGSYGGQLFSIAQPTTVMKGATVNHVIQRINLGSHTASVFAPCPLRGMSKRAWRVTASMRGLVRQAAVSRIRFTRSPRSTT